jgi:alkane 1-monooxygenase
MFIIALLPPLWFAIMNPKVVAWADGDFRRINVLQRKHSRLVAQYSKADSQASA